ncbi:MAG: HAD-IIA family hydrolase [Christensenellaceae bacterium]|nr:HAD-IIA family hydrolase [Christensenellaceae bacterium]
MNFKHKKLWLLDMDGTIYIDDHLIEGSLEFLKAIENEGGKYVFITNNSSKSIDNYINKLNNMGIKSDIDSFFTSSQSTILYIKRNYPNKKVYCMGTKALVNDLKLSGIDVVTEYADDVGVVLLGYDTELNYQKLIDVCHLLKKDLPYIATNPDYLCPGVVSYLPDCGAMSVMLEYAVGRLPHFIGKPSPYIVNDVMEKFHYTKDQTIIVGDRLYTDIATGQNMGIDTICVLSGEATMEDINKGQFKPTYIYDSVKDIPV